MAEFKRNALVVLNTVGYKDRLGYIGEATNSDRDGMNRYRVFLRGSTTILTFRTVEMRLATPEEIVMTSQNPKERLI